MFYKDYFLKNVLVECKRGRRMVWRGNSSGDRLTMRLKCIQKIELLRFGERWDVNDEE